MNRFSASLIATIGLFAGITTAPLTASASAEQRFEPAEGVACSVEALTTEGRRDGVLLSGSGGRGTVIDATWSQTFSSADLGVRLNLAELGLGSLGSECGYAVAEFIGADKMLSVQIKPNLEGSVNLALFVSGVGVSAEESEAIAEQGSVLLDLTDAGENGILGIAAYRSVDILDAQSQVWNFAVNNWLFSPLRDYTGKLPPKSSSDKRAYASGELKKFFDTEGNLTLRLRVVNTGEEEISSAIAIEQVGDTRLYDVVLLENMISVRQEDVNYQSVKLLWTYPEDVSHCGGLHLYRYDNNVPAKMQDFSSINRYDYTDVDLKQKVTYTYRIELVDSVSAPVPKVYYAYEAFEAHTKQGNPWAVIGIVLGVLAVCTVAVVIYAWLPTWRKRRQKRGES